MGRLSIGGGDPYGADNTARVRSLAVQMLPVLRRSRCRGVIRADPRLHSRPGHRQARPAEDGGRAGEVPQCTGLPAMGQDGAVDQQLGRHYLQQRQQLLVHQRAGPEARGALALAAAGAGGGNGCRNAQAGQRRFPQPGTAAAPGQWSGALEPGRQHRRARRRHR
ncbi:hypothetical protein G6F32_014735 [Rhizopus arrhizus]|nr:hypothetical protein G6F32_014735 [Rhizopus arrhizus]